MSTNDDTNAATNDLLGRRPLSGIFVHLFGLLTGSVRPGLVSLLSSREFTRENARHALNWQLSVTALTLAMFVCLVLGFGEFDLPGGGTVEILLLPDPIALVFVLLTIVLIFVLTLASFANLVFPLLATGKAIFGTPWKYPFAHEFVTDDE
jgi:uncharacterized Tic20 family protein